MSSTSEVTLIPWDPLSEPHRILLFKQRVECSWDMEMVQEIWRDEQIRGEKCIYWIVSCTYTDTLVFDVPLACEHKKV
jgi:hypothetical protein